MKSRRITAVVRGIIMAVAAAFSQTVLDDVTSVAVEQEKPAKLPDWVTMSDPKFCETYYKEATGTQEQSSRFAWRLFARLNQQQSEPGNATFSAWELWAANQNTFPKQGAPTPAPASRKGPRITRSAKVNISTSGEQEVTRNETAEQYIVQRVLYERQATEAILGTPTTNGSPRIDFPVGAIETKAQWVKATDLNLKTLPADMYTITGADGTIYGLQALHIMAKIKVYPNGPRGIDDPSWFWTTFEYYGNPNRKYLIDFVTYQDTLKYAEQKELLTQAGLANTKFAIPVDVPVFNSKTGDTTTVKGNSYLCNGTQFTFTGKDPKTNAEVNVVLGNSILEGDFTVPSPPGTKNPFRGWNASCHSCHFEAAGNSKTLTGSFHSVTGNVSLGKDSLGNKLFPIDFEWSIPFFAR